MMTRRQFFSRVLGASLFGLTPAANIVKAARLGVLPRPVPPPQLRISKALFLSLVGQTFLLTGGPQGKYAAWVQLTRVADAFLAPGTEQFSVEFHAPPEAIFPEGSYRLEHVKTGVLTLFLQLG